MKKEIALLLALVMMFALCACGSKEVIEQENVPQMSSENMYGISYSGPGEIAKESENVSQFESVDFTGVWIEKASGATIEFIGQSTGTSVKFTSADGKRGETLFDWELDGDYIIFPYMDTEILVESNDDIIELIYQKGVYVRENNYFSSTESLKIGETAETDGAEFTLNGLTFVDEVSPTTLTPSASGGLGTSPDMCFAYLTFHLKNLSKNAYDIGDALDIVVDYNDGFKFEMKGDKYSYLGIPNTTINRKITGGASSGSLISLSPLTGEDYIVLIPCADVIAEDNTSPLKIFVSIPTTEGHQTFIYKIQ